MGEIIMVRHGQANSGATTEADYDRLSPLGFQQARWLGDYFSDHQMQFDRVLSGSLRRQRETRESIGIAASEDDDPRLNELLYFPLADAMKRQHGLEVPRDPAAFAAHVPATMAAWQSGELMDIPEAYEVFESRVWALLDEALNRPERTLFVTSAGVIAMAMGRVLGLSTPALSALLLQIRNSSFHGFSRYGGALHLTQFNATPHLDHPNRHYALTFV